MSTLPRSKSSGRPIDPSRAEAFIKVCEYKEDSDDCQFSLLELEELMKSFLPFDKSLGHLDILAILIARASNRHSLFMYSPGGANSPEKVYNIKQIQTALGKKLTETLLFVHAMTGCDTTSAINGKGKIGTLLLMEKKPKLFETVANFNSPKATHKEIA